MDLIYFYVLITVLNLIQSLTKMRFLLKMFFFFYETYPHSSIDQIIPH